MTGVCVLLKVLIMLLSFATLTADAKEERVRDRDAVCPLPPDEGPCRARMPMYYYDRNETICKQFIYGGCEGNANNFETWNACNQACGGYGRSGRGKRQTRGEGRNRRRDRRVHRRDSRRDRRREILEK